MATELFCADCGARNEADATFCESCGHALAGPAPAAAAAPVAAAPRTAVAPKRRMSGWLITLIALIVVALVARFVFPLQTGLLILSIEEKLHLGPYSGTQVGGTGTADSTSKPVVDAPQPLVDLPDPGSSTPVAPPTSRQPQVATLPPPQPPQPSPAMPTIRSGNPPPPVRASGRDSMGTWLLSTS